MVAADMASFPGFPQSFRSSGHRSSSSSSKEGGVKSFMHGIVSPFTACWQPSTDSCVPGCSAPDYHSHKPWKAPVVSPLVDRIRPHRRPTSPGPPFAPRYHPSSPSAPPAPTSPERPLSAKEIENPHSNDVLCGRGGSSNRHLGNMHFRELVAANKKIYVGLTKKQKMLVARKIVEMVHSTEPSGRFLAKDLDTGLWYDIGVPRSLEKTSQALREKNSNDYPTEQGMEVIETLSEVSAGYASPRSDSGISSPVTIEDTPTSKSARSCKNVETPELSIPHHLMKVFGPKKPQEAHSCGWADYQPSSGHIEQPYLHPYPSQPPASPPRDHYHVAPRASGYHHYDATPPIAPSHYDYGNSSHYAHPEPPHYGKSPPYRHSDSPNDYREQYDYYPRRLDHREHYPSYSPVRANPHSGRHPPPPPGHYRGYPPPPPPPPRPSHPSHRSQRYSHLPPPPRSTHLAPSTPVARQRPPHYEHHQPWHPSTPPVSAAHPPPGSSPTILYRSTGSGYVRGKSEVSPERRQEWKRQRNESGLPKRLSESSLSNAVENSLSLEERVVGRERQAGRAVKALTSPSSVLQSRSRPRSNGHRKTEKEVDVSKLSGLAALSTAAFLQLDES